MEIRDAEDPAEGERTWEMLPGLPATTEIVTPASQVSGGDSRGLPSKEIQGETSTASNKNWWPRAHSSGLSPLRLGSFPKPSDTTQTLK